MTHFGKILPNLGIQIFPKNRALSLLSRYGSLTSCTISRKTYEGIPRKVRLQTDERIDEGKDGQTRIHRTLPQGGDPIKGQWNGMFE